MGGGIYFPLALLSIHKLVLSTPKLVLVSRVTRALWAPDSGSAWAGFTGWNQGLAVVCSLTLEIQQCVSGSQRVSGGKPPRFPL